MTTAAITKQTTKVTATEMAIAEATWDPAVPCTGSSLTAERKKRAVTSRYKQKLTKKKKQTNKQQTEQNNSR